LRKARFIAKEQERTAAGGLGQNRRPGLLPPLASMLRVQMVGDKACFLVAHAQVVQEGRQIVMVVEHPELALDQVLEEQGAPAARGIAGRQRSCPNQLAQPPLSARCQFARPARCSSIPERGAPLQDKGLQPAIDGGRIQTQPRRYLWHGATAAHLQQRLHAPDHPHIPIPIALSQYLLQCLDGRPTTPYLELHGTPPARTSDCNSCPSG